MSRASISPLSPRMSPDGGSHCRSSRPTRWHERCSRMRKRVVVVSGAAALDSAPAFRGAARDHPAPEGDGAEGAAGLVLRIAHRQSPSHPASNVRDLLVLLAGPARTEVQCRGPRRQPHTRGVRAGVRDRAQLGRQRDRRWWGDAVRGRRHAHGPPPRAGPSARSG